MNEAVFRFRSTGDVDISSLSVNYGIEAPSEEWCHYPYVLKSDGDQDDLYELRFPLSPFNTPENGRLTRECTITGPIYAVSKPGIPLIDVNLTIKQIACLDKLNCGDLIDQIEVSLNTDDEYIGPDGGIIEVERANFEPYFAETFVSIIDERGNPCSWASFDENGHIVITRRYFGDDGDGIRTATATYRYNYSFDSDIDDDGCSAEFEGVIAQRARRCDEADVYLIEKYTTFPRTGEERKLTDILALAGKDASAFEIKSKSDISASGDAFVTGGGAVKYSALCGYTITTASNSDENTNLLEDKIGYIVVTYHNKYLGDCTFEDSVTVRVNGITCSELLEHIYIAIKVNGQDDFITDENITINSNETTFTVYILGDGYADYFDMNEDECVIPSSVSIEGSTFTIPENEDPYLVKKYKFKFVAGIINEDYREYSTFGCSFEKEFTFTQEVYQSIEEIGLRSAENITECEGIEDIPSEHIEYEQTCDEISYVVSGDIIVDRRCDFVNEKSNNDIIISQDCLEVNPKSNNEINISQDCGGATPKSKDTITINQTCETINAKSKHEFNIKQTCETISAKSKHEFEISQDCESISVITSTVQENTQTCQ